MIDEIRVRDLALIHEAELVPSRGLTVLTGETGAGKTALLNATKLLMGARADREMVRDGSDFLEVSGRFFNMHADADLGDDGCEDDEVVVSRRVGSDGRSRVNVNGRMASVKELSELVANTIDLCGQFEHQQLMKTNTHVDILDAWAGEDVAAALDSYRAAFVSANEAAQELRRIEEAAVTTSAKLDEARFVLARIEEVDPREGEYEELKLDLERAENAESLAMAISGARTSLAEDGGALDSVSAAAEYLESMAAVDNELGKLAESLREAEYVIEDVSRDVRDYQDKIEFDPETLSEQQERFASLQGLLRNYGPTMEQVFEHRDEARETVSLVDNADARKRAAQKHLDEAEKSLSDSADALQQAREGAAPKFAEAVTRNMARLEMGSSSLACQITPLDRSQWTKDGPSSVEFMYRPGKGMTARPLSRIASGGEVSRVMLAIKVVLGEMDNVDTLVFDEVDAGVGGSTAISLADVLVDLAKTHQVIVVTHLAQVAVRGDVHYVVRKGESANDGIPQTTISQLSSEERVTEIARMLSGDATETSLAHAREMLQLITD